MPDYLVTVKLPKNPNHDPTNKVTGPCQFSKLCTDSTGQHHTFIAHHNSAAELHRELTDDYGQHVTRIESL